MAEAADILASSGPFPSLFFLTAQMRCVNHTALCLMQAGVQLRPGHRWQHHLPSTRRTNPVRRQCWGTASKQEGGLHTPCANFVYFIPCETSIWLCKFQQLENLHCHKKCFWTLWLCALLNTPHLLGSADMQTFPVAKIRHNKVQKSRLSQQWKWSGL